MFKRRKSPRPSSSSLLPLGQRSDGSPRASVLHSMHQAVSELEESAQKEALQRVVQEAETVLQEAQRQAKSWQARHEEETARRMALEISLQQSESERGKAERLVALLKAELDGLFQESVAAALDNEAGAQRVRRCYQDIQDKVLGVEANADEKPSTGSRLLRRKTSVKTHSRSSSARFSPRSQGTSNTPSASSSPKMQSLQAKSAKKLAKREKRLGWRKMAKQNMVLVRQRALFREINALNDTFDKTRLPQLAIVNQAAYYLISPNAAQPASPSSSSSPQGEVETAKMDEQRKERSSEDKDDAAPASGSISARTAEQEDESTSEPSAEQAGPQRALITQSMNAIGHGSIDLPRNARQSLLPVPLSSLQRSASVVTQSSPHVQQALAAVRAADNDGDGQGRARGDSINFAEAFLLPSRRSRSQSSLDSFTIGYEGKLQSMLSALRAKSSFREHHQRIIDELVHTEADYVNDLQIIVEIFIRPLRNTESEEGETETETEEASPIAPDDVALIFSNIEELHALHVKVLADVRVEAQKAWSEQDWGALFSKWSEALKTTYDTYTSQQARARRHRLLLAETNPQFAAFLERALQNPICRRLDLKSYLIKPVQRLCKYPLLLREILKSLDKASTPFLHLKEQLREAMASMTDILNGTNDCMIIAEGRLRLEELEGALNRVVEQYGGADEDEAEASKERLRLVHPLRQLIREDTLIVSCRRMDKKRREKPEKLHLVLCNDVLLVLQGADAALSSSSSATLRDGGVPAVNGDAMTLAHVFPLYQCAVLDVPDRCAPDVYGKECFNLCELYRRQDAGNVRYVLHAASSEQKRKILIALQHGISLTRNEEHAASDAAALEEEKAAAVPSPRAKKSHRRTPSFIPALSFSSSPAPSQQQRDDTERRPLSDGAGGRGGGGGDGDGARGPDAVGSAAGKLVRPSTERSHSRSSGSFRALPDSKKLGATSRLKRNRKKRISKLFSRKEKKGGPNKKSQLHQAVLQRQLPLVQNAVAAEGVLLDQQDEQGRTALHIAASLAAYDIVLLLLESNETSAMCMLDESGALPLHLLCALSVPVAEQPQWKRCYDALCEAGGFGVAKDGSSVLHHAGSSFAVSYIVEHEHFTCSVNAVDHAGNTPLHAAVTANATEVALALLQHGADAAHRNAAEVSARDLARSLRRDWVLRAFSGEELSDLVQRAQRDALRKSVEPSPASTEEGAVVTLPSSEQQRRYEALQDIPRTQWTKQDKEDWAILETKMRRLLLKEERRVRKNRRLSAKVDALRSLESHGLKPCVNCNQPLPKQTSLCSICKFPQYSDDLILSTTELPTIQRKSERGGALALFSASPRKAESKKEQRKEQQEGMDGGHGEGDGKKEAPGTVESVAGAVQQRERLRMSAIASDDEDDASADGQRSRSASVSSVAELSSSPIAAIAPLQKTIEEEAEEALDTTESDEVESEDSSDAEDESLTDEQQRELAAELIETYQFILESIQLMRASIADAQVQDELEASLKLFDEGARIVVENTLRLLKCLTRDDGSSGTAVRNVLQEAKRVCMSCRTFSAETVVPAFRAFVKQDEAEKRKAEEKRFLASLAQLEDLLRSAPVTGVAEYYT